VYTRYLRNKTSIPVFYRRIKNRYEFGILLNEMSMPEMWEANELHIQPNHC